MNRKMIKIACRLMVCLALVGFACAAFAQAPFRSQYFYDAKGRLTKVVDQNGNVAEYIYDRAGNILEIKRTTVTVELAILSFCRASMPICPAISSGSMISPPRSCRLQERDWS
jgi:YD repeat-containing protein